MSRIEIGILYSSLSIAECCPLFFDGLNFIQQFGLQWVAVFYSQKTKNNGIGFMGKPDRPLSGRFFYAVSVLFFCTEFQENNFWAIFQRGVIQRIEMNQTVAGTKKHFPILA